MFLYKIFRELNKCSKIMPKSYRELSGLYYIAGVHYAKQACYVSFARNLT